jgi:hypothetical protein
LNLLDFAWSSALSITQKTPGEVKILLNWIEHPILGEDKNGYVIHLASPRKIDENVLSINGLYFDADANGKHSLWRLYKASIHHLSIHTVISNFRIYKEWATGKNLKNAMFAVDVTEDTILKAYMRKYWPGLVHDAAYANQVAYLSMKESREIYSVPLRFAAGVLSHSIIGKPKGPFTSEMAEDVAEVSKALVTLEEQTYDKCSTQPNTILSIKETLQDRLKVAQLIYEKISTYGELNEVPTLPHTDHHGPTTVFNNTMISSDTERADSLNKAYQVLSIKPSQQELHLALAEKTWDQEAINTIAAWETVANWRLKTLEFFSELDEKTHFKKFDFPEEDYAEYVRARTGLIGPIRRILEQLRMIKVSFDEQTQVESGNIDLQQAIQTVATKQQRNDVFIREEPLTKSESWGILVDTSSSLSGLAGEIRGVSVSLAEVAKDLISNPNGWGMYAFDENFYVVKDFAENYTSAARSRLGGLKHGGTTYLPDAMRIVNNRLGRTPEEVKVMVVASDGYPLGYEGIHDELLKSVEDIKKNGTLLLGIGVGSTAIQKYFDSTCTVSTPYELLKYFVKSYMSITSSFY